MPTENELIEQYKISRVTVRKALDILQNEGLVAKRRGYGTFVQSKKMEQQLNQVLHFSKEMEKRGKKSTTKVLANQLTDADTKISTALQIPLSTKLAHISRLRYADDIPMCMESAYLIYENCPLVLAQNFSTSSLRTFLSSFYGIVWTHAHQNIYAIKADAKLAEYLEIKKGEPLFYIERISYDQNNQPGEFLRAYYRGDSYSLSINLSASS